MAWKKLLFEDDPPAAHESTHVSSGSDEIDSALGIAAMANLASGKVWQGNASNRPAEVDMPKPAGQLFLSAAGGWPSTTNGCAEPVKKEYPTHHVDIWNMAFDKTVAEYAQWTVVMPSDWDAGTVTAVFYWTCAAGVGGAGQTVIWAAQGTSFGDNDPLDEAFSGSVLVSDTWIADGDLHVSAATAAITIKNAGASELVQFRVFRAATSDTLGGDALLLGVMITFTRG